MQQQSHLVHLLHNGSIDQIVNLPQAVFGEKCTRVGVPRIGVIYILFRAIMYQHVNLQEECRFTSRHSFPRRDSHGGLGQHQLLK